MQRNVRPLRPAGPLPANYNSDGSPRRDPKSGAWMEI
jgi:hypothetical protein